MARPNADLYIQAGSYEPVVWTITDPVTGLPLDLTQAGYSVAGVVATRSDGTGTRAARVGGQRGVDRTSVGKSFSQAVGCVHLVAVGFGLLPGRVVASVWAESPVRAGPVSLSIAT